MNCCTANGSQGLYYAWDGILEHRNGTVTVNLLLNRRSPWVNVASSLPYRGEVRLQNKSAGRIMARIPGWVDKGEVKVLVAGQDSTPVWLQNYLLIDDLKPEEEIVIRFPMEESVERYALDSYEFRGTKYLGRHHYTITFRGNTAIRITPTADGGYATYNRGYFKNRTVPETEAADYTATKRIAW